MSRVNKILDDLYAKEKRKKFILIGLPVAIVVILIVINIPLKVFRYEGKVSGDPYLSPGSTFGMVVRIFRMIDGRSGASLNKGRFNCQIRLNTGESITARCPLDFEVNEAVIVVRMQTVFDRIFNRWSYSASRVYAG